MLTAIFFVVRDRFDILLMSYARLRKRPLLFRSALR